MTKSQSLHRIRQKELHVLSTMSKALTFKQRKRISTASKQYEKRTHPELAKDRGY